GNCYFVAKTIAKEIGENAKIIPIGRAYLNGEFKTDEETLGFVYPAYGYGLPKIVRQFVKKLQAQNAKYVFGIVTYGTRPGSVHGALKKLLKKKRIKLNYATGIKSVENFAPMFKMSDEEKVTTIIDGNEKKAIEIAQEIKSNTSNKFKSLFIFTPIISALFIMATRILPRLFVIRGCNKCGTCIKVCPMANIEMKKKKPKIKKRCNVCTACMQVCPKKAIRLLRATKKARRYFNPKVSLKEFIKENSPVQEEV
ncbi:MAG: EFR1 family ferrodoxin, partial [Firmicutes bacterium]|nr:EFR1 family ferrodoxin [Bacillota bacterium]